MINMEYLILSWFLMVLQLFQTVEALDPLVAFGGQFIHRESRRPFRPFGFHYQNTNDTSGARDTLSDADACLRDAALFQRLGINAIVVSNLNPELTHNECMSIFNSIGVYVMIGAGEQQTPIVEVHPFYVQERIQRIFALLEAFSNYDNVLGFTVFQEYMLGLWSYYQPEVRAMIRDTKQYMTSRLDRTDFPVGFSPDWTLVQEQGFHTQANNIRYILDYATCVGEQEPEEGFNNSTADFMGLSFNDIHNASATPEYSGPWTNYEMLYNISSDWLYVPLFLTNARRLDFAEGVPFEEATLSRPAPTDNFTLTEMTFNRLTGSLVGGFTNGWANYVWTQQADWGIVELNAEGDMQLRTAYASFSAAAEQLPVSELLNGPVASVSERTRTRPYCTSATTSSVEEFHVPEGTSTSIETTTYNSTWGVLPTRPPEIQSMIDNGVGASRGSHVDVTETAVVHTVRGTDGIVLSNLAITPSPSSPRDSSSPSSSGDPSESTGLSTGAQAGIGVGVSLGVIALGAVGFLFWWRRRRQVAKDNTAKGDVVDEKRGHEGPTEDYKVAEVEGDNKPIIPELGPELRHELRGDPNQVAELGGIQKPVEISEPKSPVELEGSGPHQLGK